MTILAYLLDRLFDTLLLRYAHGLRHEVEEKEEVIDPVLGTAVNQFSRSFMGSEVDVTGVQGPSEALARDEDIKEAEVVYESAQVLEHSLRNAYEARIALPGISHPSQIKVRELPHSLEVKARLPDERAGYFAIVRKPARFSRSPSSRIEEGSLVLRWE
jgi:hypothetical protein